MNDDRRGWVTFGLAVIGGAVLLGSLMGAFYGAARDVVASCCAIDEP